MKTKHTKGPWKIKQNAPCEILSSDGYTDRVAIINPDLGNSNWIQDAALIAAAPEMFEALESLNYRLTELNSEGKLNGLKLDILIRAAFDALNKARGE